MRHLLGCARATWVGMVVVIICTTFVVFSLGCMSLNIGGKHQTISPASSDNESAVEGMQRGKAHAGPGQEICVFYPVPYASPPNLEFDDETRRQIQVVDQKPDCFRVKNMSGAADISWKARGTLVTSSRAPAPATTNTVTPAEARNVNRQ